MKWCLWAVTNLVKWVNSSASDPAAAIDELGCTTYAWYIAHGNYSLWTNGI